MSDFEMLSIVLMILSIVVTVLIAYINQSKKDPPLGQRITFTFLVLFEHIPIQMSNLTRLQLWYLI